MERVFWTEDLNLHQIVRQHSCNCVANGYNFMYSTQWGPEPQKSDTKIFTHQVQTRWYSIRDWHMVDGRWVERSRDRGHSRATVSLVQTQGWSRGFAEVHTEVRRAFWEVRASSQEWSIWDTDGVVSAGVRRHVSIWLWHVCHMTCEQMDFYI